VKKNILFYIPPWIEQDRPDLNNCWVPFILNLCNRLKTHHISILLGEYQLSYLKDKNKNQIDATYLVITNNDIASRIDDYKIVHRFYQNKVCKKDYNKLLGLYKSKLSDSPTPDFVISPTTPLNLLKDLLAGSRFITFESACPTHPFPKFWYLDPFGDKPCSYLLAHEQEIKEKNITNEEIEFCKRLRLEYHKSIPEVTGLEETIQRTKQFKFNVLLPLQVSNIYSFDLSSKFESQFHYLKYVLDNTDERIGIIVTEHPFFPQITRSWVNFLSKTYPNFIFSKNTQTIVGSTQALIKHADAVINVSSTVAFLALIWNKPLISLGDNYFRVFSDTTSISTLYKYLEKPKTLDTNKLLYKLIYRYWVSEKTLFESDYLLNLTNKIGDKKTLKYDFYDDLTDPVETESTIIQELRANQHTPAIKLNLRKLKGLPHLPLIVKTLIDKPKSSFPSLKYFRNICRRRTKL